MPSPVGRCRPGLVDGASRPSIGSGASPIISALYAFAGGHLSVSSAVSACSAPSAVRANRSIGAMFFAGFGTAWLCWGDMILRGGGNWTLGLVLAAGLGLAIAAVRQFAANRSALAGRVSTPQARRAARIFHWVNGGQWVLIVVLANVLNNTGLDAWMVPMIIAVVGLHFLPLAAVMRYRPHYVSGLALLLLAVVFPFIANGGPRSGVGPVGVGLILWASAVFALTGGSLTDDTD